MGMFESDNGIVWLQVRGTGVYDGMNEAVVIVVVVVVVVAVVVVVVLAVVVYVVMCMLSSRSSMYTS